MWILNRQNQMERFWHKTLPIPTIKQSINQWHKIGFDFLYKKHIRLILGFGSIPSYVNIRYINGIFHRIREVNRSYYVVYFHRFIWVGQNNFLLYSDEIYVQVVPDWNPFISRGMLKGNINATALPNVEPRRKKCQRKGNRVISSKKICLTSTSNIIIQLYKVQHSL